MTAGWRQFSSGPLGMLFLTFPGVFLPLDMIFAGPGIMMYATPAQAAQIFVHSAALALVMSVIACLVVVSVRAPARLALAVCLTLSAFALLHSLLLWSQYFTYSLRYQWVRQVVVVVLALVAGPLLTRLARERHLAAFKSVLRASSVLMALAALGCAAIVAPVSLAARDPAVRAQAAGERPSIFLITIDTLSALYLPMYGYDRPTAPRLAELSGGATIFLRNYANANLTTPAVNSIMSGMRPWTHRAVHLEARPLAAAQAQSLPRMLDAAGYFTASVSTNPWAAPRNLGMTQYFSEISENNVCGAADPLWVLPPELQVAIRSSLAWDGVHSLIMWAADRAGVCAGRQFDPELAFAEARRIVARAPAGRPLFLWVHLFAPHAPYITPAPFVGTFAPSPEARDRASTTPPLGYEAAEHMDFPGLWRLRYQEAILYVDHHIGAFLDELKRTGRYRPSLIVITADHGESFSKLYGSHGGPALHEELVRVPLLIKEPYQTEHREVTQLSEQADLLPTILELAGIARLPRSEGISLLPAMRGRQIERPVFAMNFQQSPRLGPLDTGSVAMVQGHWKYVHYFGNIHFPFMPRLEDALYDLAADSRETRNQIVIETELAGRMRNEIEARLGQHAGRIE